MSTRYTNVQLLMGVPFDNTYQHTRWCKSQAEQEAYFSTFKRLAQGVNYSYQRDKQVFRVDAHRDQLYACNYMIFKNTATYPSKFMYAFVTDVEYVNEQTSWVHFEIDVLQTYRFDIGIRDSFVVNQHDKKYTNGFPTINTVDENMNYGSEYTTFKKDIFHLNEGVNFLVVVTSERIKPENDKIENAGGTFIGVPSPYNYYLVPFRQSLAYRCNGAGSSGLTMNDYMAFLTLDEQFSNKVVAMFVTSFIGVPLGIDNGNKNVIYGGGAGQVLTVRQYKGKVYDKDVNLAFFEVGLINNFFVKKILLNSNVFNTFQTAFSFSPTETKLFMYPYCLIEIVDNKGGVMTLRPEYLPNGRLEVNVHPSMGTSQKTMLDVVNYDGNNSDDVTLISSKFLVDEDPNSVDVKNDYALAYLQGNRNSMNAQRKNAFESYKTGNINSVLSGLGAAFSGMASFNPAVTGINSMGAFQQLNNNQTDFENQSRLLSAKFADIENVPYNVNQLGFNSSFSFGNFSGYYHVRYKVIKDEYARKLHSYFKTYGVTKNQIKDINLQTRSSWNYIKTKNINVIGSMSNEVLTKIKSIFDTGITLWHNNNVLDYNQSNDDV